MTKVAIMPIPDESGGVYFNAVAGNKHARGITAGAALDAMNQQLQANESTTLVVLQNFRPDNLFNVIQQQRLDELMKRWRSARDKGQILPDSQQKELDQLIELELEASSQRAAKLNNDIK